MGAPKLLQGPSILLRIALAALMAIAGAAGMIGPARAETQSGLVDKLFQRWDNTDTPGMTVAILREGKLVYIRGFGMANVELSVPNGPDIAYPLASNSKQFTAFAIQLLVGDGKLSLTDDVRKYVPELPDFGAPITLEMLIHHTSGLREATSLLDLQGYGPEDAVSRQQALDLLWRQRELNFRPGSEYLYNNSNYLLLGLVVERVSGMPLGEFWRRRIFQPLGMAATHASADPMPVIPHRASGYGRDESGRYTPRQTPDSLLGPSGISSTVGDLAKWLANFDNPKTVGNPAVMKAMLKTGTLGDGTPITYASGLHREHYHGLPFIEHSGRNWGYKTEILRFPARHLTIIILANTDDSDPPSLAFRIADIYLKGEFPPSPPKPAAIATPVHLIDRYIGTYAVATGTTLRAPGRRYVFRREDFIGPAAQLAAFSPRDFFSPQSDFRARFVPAAQGGPSQRVVIHNDDGDDFVARRVPEAVPPPPPDMSGSSAFIGDYWSPELGVLYRVRQRNGKLWLHYPRGEAELRPQARDVFLWRQSGDSIRFVRDTGRVAGILVTQPNQRVRDLHFAKVTMASVEP
jgi:CubicO group peptidase (beta-lactamase class C family)